MTTYYAEQAWLGGEGVDSGVLIEVDGDRFASVRPGAACPRSAARLRGLVLPGFANSHSHAFHRALRGRTHRSGGSFWTWREDMYAVAARLDPDSYHALARAIYAEMVLAGITCVGEFHYLHHEAGGVRYTDPNAFATALMAAADEAGVRLTLLDACYLTGGFDSPLEGVQLRFGDGDVEAWAERAGSLRGSTDCRVGAAIHSVRAVPAEAVATVAAWARERDAPLHFHLSEQREENRACEALHGRSPTALLDEHDALGPRSCAVHATHLGDADISLLGGSRTAVCMCATTERDLADGIGPARALADAGTPIVIGSDSHAVVDPLEEARAVELDERLASERRGHWTAAALLRAATVDGHAALGWPEVGRIEAGAVADLVAVGLDSVRLAGADAGSLLESVVFAGAAADVTDVVVSGRRVVADGRHLLVDDVAAALGAAVGAVVG